MCFMAPTLKTRSVGCHLTYNCLSPFFLSLSLFISVSLSLCLSVSLSLCLSVSLSLCLSVFQSFSLSIFPYLWLSVALSLSLSVSPSLSPIIYVLSVCACASLCLCIPLPLSVSLSLFLSVSESRCLSVSESFCLTASLTFCLCLLISGIWYRFMLSLNLGFFSGFKEILSLVVWFSVYQFFTLKFNSIFGFSFRFSFPLAVLTLLCSYVFSTFPVCFCVNYVKVVSMCLSIILFFYQFCLSFFLF